MNDAIEPNDGSYSPFQIGMVMLLFAGLVLLFVTFNTKWSVVQYLGIACVLFSAIELNAFRFHLLLKYKRLWQVLSIAATCLLVGFFEVYEVRESRGDYIITERYRRWNDAPYFRRVYGLGSGHFSASGPVTSTGKRHGHWRVSEHILEPQDQWFWYGEEVTEGEFHVLSR